MRVFIDCEWNSYKGELMSIALVPEEGYAHFYIIAPTPNNLMRGRSREQRY